MNPPALLEKFLAGSRLADRSCLITLRVLLTGAEDTGWMDRQELLERLQREYRRLAQVDPSFGPSTARQGEISPFLDEANLSYLEEHVIGRLAGEGILSLDSGPRASGNGANRSADWSGVRLTPAVRSEMLEMRIDGDPHGLLDRIDEQILAGRFQPYTPAAAVSVAPQVYEGAPEPAQAPTAPDGSILSARGLVKTYRKRRVVNEVDLQVTEGEIVGLLGPNGAGKTTTFYMMVGLISPEKGRVYLEGHDLTSVPMFRRARRGIGYLAQEPSIFRKLTVEQNILAILQMRGFARREQRARLERLLDELGIKHLRSTKAYALSGGERRRLEITRALVGEPKFMLLDEPFAGVDPIAVHDIQQIVADLRRRGIGVLISDHNVEQTLDIVDRAYIMYDGRVRVSGTVSELVWNDEVAEIYLGPTLTARMRQRYTHPQ